MAARFFLETDQPQGALVAISGQDAHHITRVLRLQAGDLIECVGVDETVYTVKLQEVGAKVSGEVVHKTLVSRESPVQLVLFQGLAKGDKMDLVIQKAVELGVQEIIPFTSAYTVVKLTDKQASTRQERWERIAYEAAKQAKRTRLPIVHKVQDFSSLVQNVAERITSQELVFVAYEGETKNMFKELDLNQPQAAAVVIGPEGGFAEAEVSALKAVGAHSLSLGPRILRTETAGLVALSLLGYRWGDLGSW